MYQRHCEQSEAIQSLAWEIWIASELMLLAMTEKACAAKMFLPVVPIRRIGRPCAVGQISDRVSGVSACQEGRFAIVTNVEPKMRWTRGLCRVDVHTDERGRCVRRNRMVLTPRRWRPAQRTWCVVAIRWQESPFTGEITYKPLRPSRREGRMFGSYLW